MKFSYVHSQQKNPEVPIIRWISRAQPITKPERWLVMPWVKHYKPNGSLKHYSCNAHPLPPCWLSEISDSCTEIWQRTLNEIHASGEVQAGDYFDFGYTALVKRQVKKPTSRQAARQRVFNPDRRTYRRSHRMKIYLSGPMTGHPHFNRPVFAIAAITLRALGFEVENPAENEGPHEDDWQGWMRLAIKQLADSDAVAVLPGWQASKGACIEVALAEGLGLPVVEIQQLSKRGRAALAH